MDRDDESDDPGEECVPIKQELDPVDPPAK